GACTGRSAGFSPLRMRSTVRWKCDQFFRAFASLRRITARPSDFNPHIVAVDPAQLKSNVIKPVALPPGRAKLSICPPNWINDTVEYDRHRVCHGLDRAGRGSFILPPSEGVVAPRQRTIFRCGAFFSVSPEILEPIRRERRVANRRSNRLVAKIVLDRAGVPPIVGQSINLPCTPSQVRSTRPLSGIPCLGGCSRKSQGWWTCETRRKCDSLGDRIGKPTRYCPRACEICRSPYKSTCLDGHCNALGSRPGLHHLPSLG